MTQSRIIFKGYGYEAAIAGFKAVNGPILSVTRKTPPGSDTLSKGKYLTGVEALEWAESIETAIDNQERRALCKAIYEA